MSRQTSHGLNDATSADQSPAPDAFAGLDFAPSTGAVPFAASASPNIPPLDLAALGEFNYTSGSSGPGTVAVTGATLFGGNVAFVDVKAGTSYTVTAGAYQGTVTGPNGGATTALVSSLGDSYALQFNFRPDAANAGHYLLSLVSGSASGSEHPFLAFGDVSVLGWNSDSVLLTTSATFGGHPASDIVISTEDMSKQAHSLPTNTVFTTTGPAPVILGVTVPEVPCFAAGTEIATPNGPRAVETLAAGDMVLTHDGRHMRVSWVGSRTVNCHGHPAPAKVLPVRVRRHAFGADMPRRDLVLSPDHAVFLGGVLIPVCELINGQTVVQERVHTVRYVHVELPLHDILLAEGLACESFLDIGNHSQFGEGADPLPLHPDFFATALAWEAACAPLCLHGPQLDAARAMLADHIPAAA